VVRAWRDTTLKQWTVASTIGLIYFLLYLVSILPSVIGVALGHGSKPFDAQFFIGTALMCLAGTYCFLVAVRLVETDAGGFMAKRRRYVVAGIAAVAAAFPVLLALAFVFADSFRSAIRITVFNTTDLALTGGLALAVYVKLKSARAARDAFHAAELERAALDREVLASRLAVMRARVEPRFLLSTLAQVERLYDRSPTAAASMLDSLIAYLRAALPQLRGESSTLGRELQLASSYLDVVRARVGSRLDSAFDIPVELGDESFPPLVILPLVEDALLNGIEPLPHGGRIDVRARVKGSYLSVSVLDDGLPREANEAVGALTARLQGMYGDDARMMREPNATRGINVTVEVPLAASAHR
jgi:LytS/YehU family sensor histidine kinase